MTGPPGHAKSELNLELASNLESVDLAEEKALEIAAQCGIPEDELHRVGISVREAMVNAVVHGNRYNRNKKVYFRVHTNSETVAITIGDEGRGFNPDAVPDPNAEENVLRQSGRGIMLIRAFMDGYEVTPRPGGGTEIRMVKNLPQEDSAPGDAAE
ncbi:MAG: ATP-binding protein [Bryobacterales bacterium]|nr:ATP-binding protein [Bryobacterales bacterium]